MFAVKSPWHFENQHFTTKFVKKKSNKIAMTHIFKSIIYLILFKSIKICVVAVITSFIAWSYGITLDILCIMLILHRIPQIYKGKYV